MTSERSTSVNSPHRVLTCSSGMGVALHRLAPQALVVPVLSHCISVKHAGMSSRGQDWHQAAAASSWPALASWHHLGGPLALTRVCRRL